MNQFVVVAMATVMVLSGLGAVGGAAVDSGNIELPGGEAGSVTQHADIGSAVDEESTADRDSADDAETPNESVAPGEQFGGVVSVSAAEFKGDLDRRAFAAALAGAETDEERAEVIASLLDRTEQRLDELEAQQTSLEDERERSDVSHGKHQARMASMYADTRGLERALADANVTAAEIPEETLQEQGVEMEQIQELQTRAAELGGPNAADAARKIAGPHAGDHPGPPEDMPHGPHGDDDRGPPGDGDRGPSDDGEHGPSGDDDDNDHRGSGGR